jgi:hypothetical protein
MQILSPERILAVWEAGRDQHELDRALTLLSAGTPEVSRAELASLTVGERDTRLLQLRALMFGPRATGIAECPQCSSRVEFPFDTSSFVSSADDGSSPHEIETDGARVRFRLPTSHDLAAVVAARDATDGLRRLIDRCVLEIKTVNDDQSRDLSLNALDVIGQAMLQADPAAEISLALECPDCGGRWQLGFDVAEFFWQELATRARQLLREIDAIARAYGWSEHEILRLPVSRRRTYLELIEG